MSSTKIAPIVGWILNLAAPRGREVPSSAPPAAPGRLTGYQAKALEESARRVSGATKGTRNATLNAEVYSVSKCGTPRIEAEHSLKVAARACGLEEEEIRKTFESAWRAGERDCTGSPPLPPRSRSSSTPTRKVEPASAGEEGEVSVIQSGAQRQLPTHSEIAMADALVSDHGVDWRYCAQQGSWLHWVGHRWQAEETHAIEELAAGVVAEVALTLKKPSTLATAGKVASVVKLARADRRVAVRIEQLDADPWVLCTPYMTTNLKTGEKGPPRHRYLCTKSTADAPDTEIDSMWTDFIRRITCGDDELARYLQRVAGYCLTGDVSEHAIFFLYGTGQNGKSVFVNALRHALGDYATVAPITLFTETAHPEHATEIARLRGARLVTASETEEGRAWAEAKIKHLTGGDRIAARFIAKDFFEYDPTFKIIISGNHKPSLRNVQKAERRRFHIIPFKAQIQDHERDPQLPDKLREISGSILTWALEGCAEWLRIGLSAPPCVRETTEAYMNTQDSFGEWIEDNFEIGPEHWELSARVFDRWSSYCQSSNETCGPHKHLTMRLEGKGFSPTKRFGKRIIEGLKLK